MNDSSEADQDQAPASPESKTTTMVDVVVLVVACVVETPRGLQILIPIYVAERNEKLIMRTHEQD